MPLKVRPKYDQVAVALGWPVPLKATATFLVFAVQPEQPATVGGGAMGPNSFSTAIASDSMRLSWPGRAANCSPVGMPWLSKPMGKANAAGSEVEQLQELPRKKGTMIKESDKGCRSMQETALTVGAMYTQATHPAVALVTACEVLPEQVTGI